MLDYLLVGGVFFILGLYVSNQYENEKEFIHNPTYPRPLLIRKSPTPSPEPSPEPEIEMVYNEYYSR